MINYTLREYKGKMRKTYLKTPYFSKVFQEYLSKKEGIFQ